MSPAAETVEIVFTITISMPEIQEDAWNRFPSPIQNKPSDVDRRPVYPRFAKVVLERRVRLKKRTSSLFWCHFQLVTCGGRRLQFNLFDLAAQSRPDSGKKRHRRHCDRDRAKKSASRESR